MNPTILIRTLVAAVAISVALALVATAAGAELRETASTETLVFPGLVVQVTTDPAIAVVQTDELPDWPDEWVCVDLPQDDPFTLVAECGWPDDIAADHPGVATYPAGL